MPNSETPMSAAAIARQDRFVAAIGKKFTDGNAAMARDVAMLTPPVPVGTCDDFTNSRSMSNLTPFPWPVPGALDAQQPAAGPGPGASAVPPAVVASGLGDLSPGWKWMRPGGGSTYPWGPAQLSASQLVPPWACSAPGAAGAPGGSAAALAAPSWPWGTIAAVALVVALLATSGDEKKTKGQAR